MLGSGLEDNKAIKHEERCKESQRTSKLRYLEEGIPECTWTCLEFSNFSRFM